MVASRSMNSWDVVVTKENGKIFLDKRVDSDFDYVTVSETSNETLPTEPTDINSAFSLSREATRVNNSFKSFAVDKVRFLLFFSILWACDVYYLCLDL